MRTRRASVSLLLLLLLFFAGCQSNDQYSVTQPPLTVLTGTDVSTFDPQVPFEVETSYVLNNIFETLVEFDPTFHLVPRLAVRWTNPDDRTWRFYLNEKARFSDGSSLTANDVAFSINRLKSLTNSDLQGFTEHIQSIHIIDDQTLEITTSTPASILNDLVFIPIMNEKQVRAAGSQIAEKPMGTGPYRLVKWDRKKQIILTQNEFYEMHPQVKQVRFIISEDPEKVLDDILARKPDLSLYIPFRKIEEFNKRKPADLSVLSSNGISVEYLTVNMRPSIPDFKGKNPLSDVRIRKALAYAMNNQEIVQKILMGFGRPASQLIAPEIFGFDPSIQPIPYDPAKAKQLLSQSGYDGTEIPVYTVEGGSYRLEKALMKQWADVGVNAQLKILTDTKEMNNALFSGAFTVTIQGYSCTSGDASEVLTFSFHTQDEKNGYGKGNYAGYSNPELDHIAEENLRVLNPRARLEMLQRAMRIVSDDLPYIPLIISPDVYIVSKRINWTPSVTGDLRLKMVTFRNPQL
jgi:peptide/nickel transport system substrate-binding protein